MIGELEDGDRFDTLVDDPVLGDGRLGIVGALDDKIAWRIGRRARSVSQRYASSLQAPWGGSASRRSACRASCEAEVAVVIAPLITMHSYCHIRPAFGCRPGDRQHRCVAHRLTYAPAAAILPAE